MTLAAVVRVEPVTRSESWVSRYTGVSSMHWSPPPPPLRPTPSWLLSRSFHCALLCVCFELVFSAYKHSLLVFPQSLHLFGITHWDLLKVVDTALRFSASASRSVEASRGRYGGQYVRKALLDAW